MRLPGVSPWPGAVVLSLHLARRERLMPGEPLLEYLHTQRITHALLAPVALAALAALPPLSADDLPCCWWVVRSARSAWSNSGPPAVA